MRFRRFDLAKLKRGETKTSSVSPSRRASQTSLRIYPLLQGEAGLRLLATIMLVSVFSSHTAVAQECDTAAVEPGEIKYAYDALGRLHQVCYDAERHITDSYDQNGNRTSVNVIGGNLPEANSYIVVPLNGFTVLKISPSN